MGMACLGQCRVDIVNDVGIVRGSRVVSCRQPRAFVKRFECLAEKEGRDFQSPDSVATRF